MATLWPAGTSSATLALLELAPAGGLAERYEGIVYMDVQMLAVCNGLERSQVCFWLSHGSCLSSYCGWTILAHREYLPFSCRWNVFCVQHERACVADHRRCVPCHAQAQWEALFAASDFRLQRIWQTRGTLKVVEAAPV